jgi:PfaD family protein
LRRDQEGRIVRPQQLIAKLSRPEIARRFASPAPTAILSSLVGSGHLTAQEAELAAHIPLAQDITVEADSGGHTDNRPLGALFPTIAQAVRQTQVLHGYSEPIRLGAAGGLGEPQSVAAAFALGAAYVVTGSINQAAVESGLSSAGRALLAQAAIEDVAMAPAADMFEMGVEVQVLRRGTMFAARGGRLHELYHRYESLAAIPAADRARLETEVFRAPIDQVWKDTERYFTERDPAQVARAHAEPKHQMALVFRWYLGKASRWAIDGTPDRVLDFQIWCGPAMGAFNDWVRGSFLEAPSARTVGQIALNLMEGAAVVTRASQLRTFGAAVPAEAFDYRPVPLSIA